MATLAALLLSCALPAAAQVDPVSLRPGHAFAPAASVVTLDRRQDTRYAQAADVDAARTLLGHGRLIPLKFNAMSPAARQAVLNGLESLARTEPKDTDTRAALQTLIVHDELAHIEPRLRSVELTPERRDAVLAQVEFRDVKWYHRWDPTVDPDGAGIPDGRTYPDNRIAHFVRGGGFHLPDLVGHHRVLFAHEYTHRLQNEGEFTFRGEVPAVGTELLRALELYGVPGLQAGMIDFICSGVLGSFTSGRAWARDPARRGAETNGFYHRGFLAGAAYELALRTGRWSDAWLFNRLVAAKVAPADAAARIEGATR